MPDEVAVFIDFENLRYGLLNHYGIEPDFQAVVEKARKYGRPTVMRAYADFTEHPSGMNRQLEIAGIEAINIPVKRVSIQRGETTIERVKNAADMCLALDALLEAVDAHSQSKSKVFLIVTGDRDYVRLITQIRNRFGQRVVVAGVPGSISNDLVIAVGEENNDPIEVPEISPVDTHELKIAIIGMIHRGPAPLAYLSMRLIDQWCQDARQKLPGTAKERRDALSDLKSEGVLSLQERKDEKTGRTVTEVVLNEETAVGLSYLTK